MDATLRALFAADQLLVHITDGSGLVVQANQACKTLFISEGSYASWMDPDEARRAQGQALATRRFVPVRGQLASGAILEGSVGPTVLADGAGALWILTDQSRDAALADEVDGFFELTVDLLMVADHAGRFVKINPRWRPLMGYSLDELIGKSYAEFIHPDDLASTAAMVAGIAGGSHTEAFRNRFRRADGTYCPLEWSAAASPDGRRLFAVARSLVGRLKTETALHLSEARTRAILDASVDGILSIDTSGILLSANPAAETLFGYTASEMLGNNVSMLMPEPDRSQHDRYLANFLGGSGREVTGLRKDGTRFAMYLGVGEVHVDGQRTFTGVVRDISERIKNREALEAVNRALAASITEVRAATAMKTSFLANMSHELRTPLNGILGFGKLLLEGSVGPLNDMQKEFLGDVVTSGEHLLRLINDILDLSRVEAGKLIFAPTDVVLEKLVSDVMAITREMAAKRRIKVTWFPAEQVSEVRLDPGRLKQVLFNFLSNALKFAPESSEVKIVALPDGPDHFRIDVIDEGPGIDLVDQERLFEPFEQLSEGRDKRHQGTGLGLALSRQIVEAQGGRIELESALGVGSRFSAVLPRSAGIGQALDQALSLSPYEEPDRETLATILVVEDDANERAWMRKTLGAAGYAVDAVATGAAAMRRLRDRVYDAVTLDLFLPDMNGLEVLAYLRKEAKFPDVPVVLVTVVPDRGIAVGHTISDFMVKPCDGNELVAALRRLGAQTNRPVLIVDDDKAVRLSLTHLLEGQGFSVRTAEDGETGLAMAAAEAPSAIVLDLAMPKMDGFAFLEQIRRTPIDRAIPIIVHSGRDLDAETRARLQQTVAAVVPKGADAERTLVAELNSLLERA